MIIKKPYRSVSCKWWNKNTKEFDSVTVKTYIGYFLFGIIPIYMVLLNETTEFEKVKLESFGNEYENLLLKRL